MALWPLFCFLVLSGILLLGCTAVYSFVVIADKQKIQILISHVDASRQNMEM
jgi:hypothetical protein